MTTHTPRPSRLFFTALFLFLSITVVGCGSSPSGTSGFGLPTAPSALTAPLSVPPPEAPEVAAPAAPTSINPVAFPGGESRTASTSLDDLDDLDAEVIGLVEDITGSETCPTRSFSIRDRRVTTSGDTRYEDVTCETLAARQVVKVEGSSLPDGSILARKVERRDEARPAGQVELRGVIRNLEGTCSPPEAKTFDLVTNLGTDHVIPSGGTRYEGLTCETLENEQNVKVEGTRRASDGAVLAHKIELRDARPPDKFEAKGTASNVTGSCPDPGLAFDLLHRGVTTRISTDRLTRFKVEDRHADCPAFLEALTAPGAEVEVKSRRPIRDAGRVTGWTADEAEVELRDARPPDKFEAKGTASTFIDSCPAFGFDLLHRGGTTRIRTDLGTRFEVEDRPATCQAFRAALMAPGAEVEVKSRRPIRDAAGLVTGWTADEAEVEARDARPPGGEVEVRGVIRNLGGTCSPPEAKTFDLVTNLGTNHVITSPSTRYDDTSCAALRNGMKVEVKGMRQADRAILASRIEKDD